MEQHYICTGECEGVSEYPKMCEAKECSKRDQPLEPCDCEDGKHNSRQVSNEEQSEI